MNIADIFAAARTRRRPAQPTGPNGPGVYGNLINPPVHPTATLPEWGPNGIGTIPTMPANTPGNSNPQNPTAVNHPVNPSPQGPTDPRTFVAPGMADIFTPDMKGWLATIEPGSYQFNSMPPMQKAWITAYRAAHGATPQPKTNGTVMNVTDPIVPGQKPVIPGHAPLNMTGAKTAPHLAPSTIKNAVKAFGQGTHAIPNIPMSKKVRGIARLIAGLQ